MVPVTGRRMGTVCLCASALLAGAAGCSAADQQAVVVSAAPQPAEAPASATTAAQVTRGEPSGAEGMPETSTPDNPRARRDAAGRVEPEATAEATQLPAGPVTDGAGRWFVIPCAGDDPAERPTSMTTACADAGAVVIDLTWSRWGGPVATATGFAEVNTCDPSCAEGRVKRYPVAVELSKPLPRPTGNLYSVLAVVYTDEVPEGFVATEEHTIAR